MPASLTQQTLLLLAVLLVVMVVLRANAAAAWEKASEASSPSDGVMLSDDRNALAAAVKASLSMISAVPVRCE